MIKRRRRLSLTNYRKRIAMLRSGLPRLVIRKSNRSITMQIVKYSPNGDTVLATVNSSALKHFGWEPRANIPTAYLTGLLLAKKRGSGADEVIVDMGLYKPIKGSVIFAAAKGAQDGGMKVRGSFAVDEKRIEGSHIMDYANKLEGEAFKRQFAYTKINPKNIKEEFEKAKKLLVVS